MSFDTYITLVFGTLLVLIITICVEIAKTKSNKPGLRQLKFLRVLIAICIVAFFVLTIIYFASRGNQIAAAFEQKVDDAEFSLNNEEYLKAAELYHQAQQLSYDTDTNLRATYGQGMSYFLYGLIMSDDAYYKKAAVIYTGIIRQPNLEYSEHYVDALADLSFIYYYTPYAWDNPEWTALVGKLETMLSDMPSESFEQLSSSQLSLRFKVIYALALYYESASKASLENVQKKELSAKALRYFEELRILYQLTTDEKGSLALSRFRTYSLISIADAMLNYSIHSDNFLEFCQTAIELCEAVQGVYNLPVQELIESKKVIGKALVFLSHANITQSQKEDLLQQAYDAMHQMLEAENNSALMDLSYYLLLTNHCTQAELDRILDIYDWGLSETSATENPERRTRCMFSASLACKAIAEDDPSCRRAVRDGLAYCKELMGTLRSYVAADQLTFIEEAYGYFISLSAPHGYQITLSASRVVLNQRVVVTVTPDADAYSKIIIHAVDPLGKLWEFTLDSGNQKTVYVDQPELIGAWTLYATVVNEYGAYSGQDSGPYAELIVELAP